MQEAKERGVSTGLVIGGVGVGAVATAIALLMAARPVKAATTDEKFDFLIEALTTLVPVLAELTLLDAELVELLRQLVAAQGLAPAEGKVEISVSTPWLAKVPSQIFKQAIRSTGTLYTDRMVDWTRGKRVLFKAESSLNQAVNLQTIGNIVDDTARATDIDGVLPLAANSNTSVGLAWDDWHPFVGIRITVAVAPTAGILTITEVVQE